MSAALNRRSQIILYSDPEAINSHRVRVVLAEKGIKAAIVSVDPDSPPEDLLTLNPLGTLPTLVDQELVLYDPRVIIDYLDERYPHPPLLPPDPISRARTRLALFRIEHDWYSLIPTSSDADPVRDQKAVQLAESLTAASEIFRNSAWLFSEDYSVLDSTLAPLLWRLPRYGIVLPKSAAPVHTYAKRLFSRPGFQESLSPQEKESGA